MNRQNEADRRFFKVMQTMTLIVIVGLAFYSAFETKAQSDRLAARATEVAEDNRHALGALINWVTCQAAIPLDERTPRRLDECFDILRAEGIPISVPDLPDNTPTPTPAPSPAPSPSPTVAAGGTNPLEPAPAPEPAPEPPRERDRRRSALDCPGHSGDKGHGCQQRDKGQR